MTRRHNTNYYLLVTVIISVLALDGCGQIEQRHVLDKQKDTEITSGVGDLILRVSVKESLPNIYGKADIFGRTRERGFSEIRYMGMAHEMLVFRRRDVDIFTNETTISRSGVATSVINVQPAGDGVVAYGVGTRPTSASIAVVPPDTVEFTLDPRQSRIVTMRGHKIEIIEATPTSIRYIIR